MQSYELPETGAIREMVSSMRHETIKHPEECQRVVPHDFVNDRSEENAMWPVLGALTQRHSARTGPVRRARRLALFGVSLVVIWSLAEMPVELAAVGSDAIAALLFSKVLLTGIGVGAVWGAHWAKCIFIFICLTSLLAIVPALPFELKVSPVTFFCSLIECLVKAAAFGTFVWGLGDGGPNRHEKNEV